MILGISKAPAARVPLSSSGESYARQPQQHPLMRSTYSSSSVPLQTLVAIASSLFDESNRAEQRQKAAATRDAARPLRQQQQRQHDETPHRQEGDEDERTPSRVAAPASCAPMVSSVSAPDSVATARTPPATGGILLTSSTSHVTTIHQPKPAKWPRIIYKPAVFQCCTREGFLSRLRNVLEDPSMADVLSWMPDGEAFTIVSPKRFAKKGLVHQLFGIQKMSSFLRRLNQLGFVRVRDPTDPTNLDVFRKKGFTKVVADTPNLVEERTESPTSTLQYAPTLSVTKQAAAGVRDPPSSPASSVTTASSLTTSFGGSNNNNDTASTASSVSTLTAATATSPQPPRPQQQFLSIHPPSLAMPVPSTWEGPVRLRPRGESFAGESTASSSSVWSTPDAAPPRSPPRWSTTTHRTPVITNKRPLLGFSPGKMEYLGVPALGPTLRPPPVQFVADCIQRMAAPGGAGSDPPPPSLRSVRHSHEYLSLWMAAEAEANAVLRNGGTGARDQYEASVIGAVELLRGGGVHRLPFW